MTIEILIDQMMRKAGVKKYHLAERFKVSSPTAKKLLEDVLLLNGYQKMQLAEALKVSPQFISDLIDIKMKNGSFSIEPETVETYMEKITPKQNKPKKQKL